MVIEAIQYLANPDTNLTKTEKSATKRNSGQKKGKRASLGSIPDFANPGKGVLLSGVVPGSPASKIGMKAKDVIVQLGKLPVNGLADLAYALRYYKAGQTIEITFLRGKKKIKKQVTLVTR